MIQLVRRPGEGTRLELFEDYALDTERQEVCRRVRLVAIEPKVFELPAYVIRNRERVASEDEITAVSGTGAHRIAISVVDLINAPFGSTPQAGLRGTKSRLPKTGPWGSLAESSQPHARRGLDYQVVFVVREEPS